MSQALIGKKIGMSRLFTEEGASIPVTVIELQPSRVVAIKTIDNDGYDAVQVTTGEIKASKLTKAEKGHFSKANVEPGVVLSEIRAKNKAIFNKNLDEIQAGAIFDLGVFDNMKKVDVSGITKGKGFAGVIKRWNFSMQDATHGNSLSHRAPGSIGQTQTPGRVWKGKKMAGQMGNKKSTVQSLEIVRIDAQQQLILLKGGVPGAPGTMVRLAPSVKLKNNFLE